MVSRTRTRTQNDELPDDDDSHGHHDDSLCPISDADLEKIAWRLFDLLIEPVEVDGTRRWRRGIEIASAIHQEFAVPMTRQSVLVALRRAGQLGLIGPHPRQHQAYSLALAKRCALPKTEPAAGNKPDLPDIRVIPAFGPRAADGIGQAAADLVLELILKLGKERNGAPVHIGLGVGRMTDNFARALVKVAQNQPELPPLVVHALAPGHTRSNHLAPPFTSAVHLHTSLERVDYVGLFVDPFVPHAEYAKVLANPRVADAFERRDEIDIVVTSLGDAADEHSHIAKYLDEMDASSAREMRKLLHERGWIGDIHLRFFSKDGPIQLNAGMRTLTLFEDRKSVV
jgi:DNA-binding transcriptional regulator LsrR (DeoR family)